MKKILLIFNFTFLIFNSAFPQAGEWVWLKGDSVPNQPGNYGVQGVPSPTNNPPSLYEPCEWTDLNGNFWLYGGYRRNGQVNELYGDLWKYDPVNNEWTWMKGSGIPNDSGSYGAPGIPSPVNNPPARGWGVASWTDLQGNLWMFGGADSSYYPDPVGFSDLWKYDILTNEWTWMKGPALLGQLGIYGVQGIPSASNNPGARSEVVVNWVDSLGNLWLFGGFDAFTFNSFNDIWKYDIAQNEWTWMKGSQLPNQSGFYGSPGVEDSAYTPHARAAFSDWKDHSGFLWVFGGGSFAPSWSYNDMWRFNPITNNWAFMGGSPLVNTDGVYSSVCLDSVTNLPCGRIENRTTWKDQDDNFWMFGGGQFYFLGFTSIWNDLWKYCPESNEWIWISGDSTMNSVGNWGIKGVSNAANIPNARVGGVGWSDNNGHYYFFGGYGCLNSNPLVISPYNDIWKYTIDTTCGICPNTTTIAENNPTKADELLVFPNPTNSSLTISFQSSTKENIELRIYNTLGKQVYFSKEEISKGKFEKEINVEKLSGGIYLLQLKTTEGLMSRKVIVQH